MIRLFCITFAIIINLLAIPIVQASDTTKKNAKTSQTGITIVQIHHILGPCKTYVTQNAVKVDFSRQEWWLFSKSPKWNVLLIHKKDGKYFVHSIESWQKEGLSSIDLIRESSNRFNRHGPGIAKTYYGFGTKKYLLSGKRSSFTCLDSWPHSPQIDRILQKLFNTPSANGIPLFYKVGQKLKDTKIRPERITYFASKQFENKLESFYIAKGIKTQLVLPKGLKPVGSERKIVLGKSKVNNLSKFYDSFRSNE